MIVSLDYVGNRLWIPYPEKLDTAQLKAAKRLANRKNVEWPVDFTDRVEENVSVAQWVVASMGLGAVIASTMFTRNNRNLLWLLALAALVVAIRLGSIVIPTGVASIRNEDAASRLEACEHGYSFGDEEAWSLLDEFLAINSKTAEWLDSSDPLDLSALVAFLTDPAIKKQFAILEADENAPDGVKLNNELRNELKDALKTKAEVAFMLVDAPRAEKARLERIALENEAKSTLK